MIVVDPNRVTRFRQVADHIREALIHSSVRLEMLWNERRELGEVVKQRPNSIVRVPLVVVLVILRLQLYRHEIVRGQLSPNVFVRIRARVTDPQPAGTLM